MTVLFLACFLFGALFTIVSAVFGMASGHAHGGDGGHGHGHGGDGWHGHASGHGHAHGDTGPLTHDASGAHHVGDAGEAARVLQWLLSINVTAIVTFFTWFGAIGFVLTGLGVPALLALPVAAVAGYGLARGIAWLFRLLRRDDRELDPADFRLEGTVAKVTVTIPAGGVGEVLFTQAGARRSEAARGLDGMAVERETEVVITAYDKGMATVQPWQELVKE